MGICGLVQVQLQQTIRSDHVIIIVASTTGLSLSGPTYPIHHAVIFSFETGQWNVSKFLFPGRLSRVHTGTPVGLSTGIIHWPFFDNYEYKGIFAFYQFKEGPDYLD